MRPILISESSIQVIDHMGLWLNSLAACGQRKSDNSLPWMSLRWIVDWVNKDGLIE